MTEHTIPLRVVDKRADTGGTMRAIQLLSNPSQSIWLATNALIRRYRKYKETQ
jgi:hypothetical protein